MDARFRSPSQIATGPAVRGLSTTLRIASRTNTATLRAGRRAALTGTLADIVAVARSWLPGFTVQCRREQRPQHRPPEHRKVAASAQPSSRRYYPAVRKGGGIDLGKNAVTKPADPTQTPAKPIHGVTHSIDPSMPQ